MSAKFQGRREGRIRDRTLGKCPGDRGPDDGCGVLEGRAVGSVIEQDGATAQLGGKIAIGRPEVPGKVDVGDTLAVAVEIEDEVALYGEPEQRLSELIGLSSRGPCGHRIEEGPANSQRIGFTVIGQGIAHVADHGGAQVRIPAVEIAITAQIETAQVVVEDAIGKTDGIGKGNDCELGVQASLPVSLLQPGEQAVEHQGSRELVGVQRRLEVEPGPCALLPESMHDEMAFAPRPRGHERNGLGAVRHRRAP